MFFSMTNSLATFQTMMNDIFYDLIAESIMIVYIDNILIFHLNIRRAPCSDSESFGSLS